MKRIILEEVGRLLLAVIITVLMTAIGLYFGFNITNSFVTGDWTWVSSKLW